MAVDSAVADSVDFPAAAVDSVAAVHREDGDACTVNSDLQKHEEPKIERDEGKKRRQAKHVFLSMEYYKFRHYTHAQS